MAPSYGTADTAMALSAFGGETKVVMATCPCSRAPMTVLSRGIAVIVLQHEGSSRRGSSRRGSSRTGSSRRVRHEGVRHEGSSRGVRLRTVRHYNRTSRTFVSNRSFRTFLLEPFVSPLWSYH